MVSDKLHNTIEATFCITLPDEKLSGMPRPFGTGFFVSPDGWLITAAHVITQDNRSDGPVRANIAAAKLEKELRVETWPSPYYQGVSFELVDPATDFALLKVDFDRNRDQAALRGKSGFPHLMVSSRKLDIGEEVYSFGYPLADYIYKDLGDVQMGGDILCPRLTSAIISSDIEHAGMVVTSSGPSIYVLDKALNYGNSGGPIISKETGHVYAFCSRFQPVYIPQVHLQDSSGHVPRIMIPSLYGIVSGLSNPGILDILRERGVPISEE